MKKILITGGAGFLGQHLARACLKAGRAVAVVDSLVTGKKANLRQLWRQPNFSFYRMAVESPKFLEIFLPKARQFSEIYDLACPTGVPNIEKMGEEMLLACSVGTLNTLKLARRARAGFLLASSSEVYGQPKVFPQSEAYAGNADPLGPRANYEEGKRFAETLVKWFADKYRLNAKIVRLFNVYGPGMSLTDFRVAPRFIRQAVLNRPLTVHGQGRQKRTFCFIDDIVDGLQSVMQKGQAGEAYNLGSQKEISMLDLARAVIRLSGSRSKIKFTPRPAHDHASCRPDLKKIRALGWRQTVPLDQGLKLALADFKLRL